MQKRSPRQEIWADVMALSQHAPRQGMIYGHFKQFGRDIYETRFYIHECQERLEQLRPDTPVRFRAGLLIEAGVVLVPVLAQVGDKVYETWLDFHRSNTSLCFADLMHQDSIFITLYDSTLLRRFWAHNEMISLFELAMREICHVPPWSAGAFSRAREQALQRYATVETLWSAITSSLPTAPGSDSIPHPQDGKQPSIPPCAVPVA